MNENHAKRKKPEFNEFNEEQEMTDEQFKAITRMLHLNEETSE